MISHQIKQDRKISNKKEIFSNLIDGGCKQICDYFFSKDYKLNNYVCTYKSELLKIKKEKDILNRELFLKDEVINNQNERIKYLENLEQELASIKYSRSYRFIEKIKSIFKNSIK